MGFCVDGHGMLPPQPRGAAGASAGELPLFFDAFEIPRLEVEVYVTGLEESKEEQEQVLLLIAEYLVVGCASPMCVGCPWKLMPICNRVFDTSKARDKYE